MRHKKICKAPPGWPARAELATRPEPNRAKAPTRKGKLGLLLLVLPVLLATAVTWAGTQPVEKEQYLTTSNRPPEGMVINRIAKPQPVFYSPNLLSSKKTSNWEQMLPLAKPVLIPYNLDWRSFNSGGASFGTSATRHLGYSVGQSVAGEGSSGSNNLGIGFWYGTGAACSVYCPPGGIAEGEACYLPGSDVTNGGCNSSPEVYSLVNCGDTICGTAEAESGTRDTDWYLHRYTSDTIVTWKVVAEFPVMIAIVDLAPGCPSVGVVGIAFGNPCDTVQLTADLSAGNYVFFVAPSVYDGFACVDGPHDYAAWLECAPNCAPCPPGGIAEGEPCIQVYPENFNGGCNSAPPVYSPINVGDTVCGTAWADTAGGGLDVRDTDWYEKVLTESTVVRWSAVAEFPSHLAIIDGTGGCGGYVVRKQAFADSCDTGTIIDTLPPGTFWFFAAPQVFTGYPCADGPHKYTAWLVEACGAAKGDLNGVGGFTPSDVVLMLRCVFNSDGTGTLGGDCNLCYSDVNCSGGLSPSDVVLELNRVFNGSTAPPWCGGP